jgi:hypothetical protein
VRIEADLWGRLLTWLLTLGRIGNPPAAPCEQGSKHGPARCASPEAD